MTPEQDRELLGKLIDLIESLYRRKLVLEAVLEVFAVGDWYPHFEKLEKTHAARIHAMLQPFRDAILGQPDETIGQPDWHQIVRGLIESVGEIPPTE